MLSAPAAGSTLGIRAVIFDSLSGATRCLFNISVEQPKNISLRGAEGEARKLLQEGDTQTFVAQASALASYLASSSEDEIPLNETRAARIELLKMVGSVTANGVSSGVDQASSARSLDAATSAALVESLTSQQEPGTRQIDGEVQTAAIRVLSSIARTASDSARHSVQSDGNDGGPLEEESRDNKDLVGASTSAVKNIIASASFASLESPANEDGLQPALASQVEGILSSFSDVLIGDSVPGEAEAKVSAPAQRTDDTSLEISGQVVDDAALAGTTLRHPATGARVAFPSIPLLSDHGSGDTNSRKLSLSFASIRNGALYPTNGSASSGVSVITLKDQRTQEEVTVANLTDPVVFVLPPGRNLSRTLARQAGLRYKCNFWDSASGSWLSRGLRTTAFDNVTGGVTCSSSHLTSFSADLDFQVQINLPTQSSVTDTRALDPTESSAVATLICILGMFVASYPIFRCFDNREKKHAEKSEIEFWRRHNNFLRLHAEVGFLSPSTIVEHEMPLFTLKSFVLT